MKPFNPNTQPFPDANGTVWIAVNAANANDESIVVFAGLLMLLLERPGTETVALCDGMEKARERRAYALVKREAGVGFRIITSQN